MNTEQCATVTHMSAVGLRAIQQNASAVVARVVAGETVEITDRGRPVARIVPLRPTSKIQELIDEGRVRVATRNILDVIDPVDLPSGSMSLSESLAEMRSDER